MNSQLTEKTDLNEGVGFAVSGKSAETNGHDRNLSSFRGWILYDRDCSSCTASVARFDRVFARRGFLFLPLQTKWVMERLNLQPDTTLEEMHVLTGGGQDIAGANAIIFLARQIWWAWPMAALAKLPAVHGALDRGYRWLAAHRGRGACQIRERTLVGGRERRAADPSKTRDYRQPRVDLVPAWILLIELPILVLPLRNHLAPWQFMWLMAAAIFFGCKWLTAWRAVNLEADLAVIPTLAYFFAWPGMDAEKFLAASRENMMALSHQVRETAARWFVSAIAKIVLGTVLLFGLARFTQQSLVTGWIGMIGLILILHFGVFQLLAAGWRKAGMDVEPIMKAPLRSKSVADFWGQRWNSAFNRLAFEFVSRPLLRRFGGRRSRDAGERSRSGSKLHRSTAVAILAAFFVSGLIHELVVSLPAGAGYGLPTSYFLLQGIGILLERSLPQIRSRAFTILVTAVPAYWLFHPPFVHNVILPFMKAIGAL